MPANVPIKRLVVSTLLALLATSAAALEVTLDSATAMTNGGEFKLRVDSRANFDFNPATSTLTSTGAFTAQYVFGPNQLTRFTHKLDDFAASMDGRMSMKSYECVEGTVGGILAANHCGNYRFGPNGIDDGGVVDDVIVGPRKSLTSFTVSALTWDGESLLLILSTDGIGEAVFQEYSLELKFSAAKARQASRQPSAR